MLLGLTANAHGKYLLWIFPLVGAFMLAAGFAYRRRLKARLEGCLRTYGTVIGSVREFGAGFDPAPVYRPIVEYSIGNQRFSFTGDVGYGQKLDEGKQLAIMYNPANPSVAFITRDYYTAAHMLLGIGGAFVGFGLFAAYASLF